MGWCDARGVFVGWGWVLPFAFFVVFLFVVEFFCVFWELVLFVVVAVVVVVFAVFVGDLLIVRCDVSGVFMAMGGGGYWGLVLVVMVVVISGVAAYVILCSAIFHSVNWIGEKTLGSFGSAGAAIICSPN